MLLSGLAWHVWITQRDWDYWQDAPNSFNLFLLVQYILLALCIRVPAMTACKQQTITQFYVMLAFLLLVNTIVGTIWFFELTDLKKQPNPTSEATTTTEATTNTKPFDLKDDYLAHGIIMILIPWSIMCFLIIVLVKVICFFFVDHKKKLDNSRRRSNYGEFNDDEPLDQETEAVISVYLKIMDKVKYQPPLDKTVNSENSDFMATQKQCRLCL